MKIKANEIALPSTVKRGRIDLTEARKLAALAGPMTEKEKSIIKGELEDAIEVITSKENLLKVQELALKETLGDIKKARQALSSAGKAQADDQVQPTTTDIRGDPESFQLKHQQLQFENKDTRLVISYHVLDDPAIPEVLTDLRFMDRVALPGLEEDEYLSVTVMHRQKTEDGLRTDVHHNWLNLHLPTGLSCNPYYHKSDLPRFDLAKQILNFVRGYQEPAAAEHSRYFGYTVEGSKANELGKVMKEIFETQKIASRNELIVELELRNYKVRRRKNGKPKTAERARHPEIETGGSRKETPGPGEQVSGSPNPGESIQKLANNGAGRSLADTAEQAAEVIGKLVTRLVSRIRLDLTSPVQKSKRLVL